jgi:uncharacterized protein YhdP
VLRIDGQAAGSTTDFFRFIADSPVAGWTDHFTDGVEANGAGTLTIKLELPLGKPEANKVAGEYSFTGNRIKLSADAPAITQLNGKVAFTYHEGRAQQLTGEMLGGPARISIASAEGSSRVGAGQRRSRQLRVAYPGRQRPSASREPPDGSSRSILFRRVDLGTETNLKGAVIDFPAPLAKAAAETVPLQIERRASESGRDTLLVRYGTIGRLVLQRRLTSSGATAERALLALGGAQGEPEHAGLSVRGSVEGLNVDAWLALKQERDATGLGEDLPLNGVDLAVGTLDVFGRRFNDLHVAANRGLNGGRWISAGASWPAPPAGRARNPAIPTV